MSKSEPLTAVARDALRTHANDEIRPLVDAYERTLQAAEARIAALETANTRLRAALGHTVSYYDLWATQYQHGENYARVQAIIAEYRTLAEAPADARAATLRADGEAPLYGTLVPLQEPQVTDDGTQIVGWVVGDEPSRDPGEDLPF